MKKKLMLGMLCVFGSAVIFGFTPVLAAISYQGGNNGINMAFLRAVLPLPLLIAIGWRLPLPNRSQCRQGLLAGVLSFGCSLLLYSSYEHISPGLATTLHFLYPLYVVAYEAVRFRKRPGVVRLCGLGLGLLGTLLFLERGENGSLTGFVLALTSGMTFAAYIIVLGQESRQPMPLYRLMLLVSLSGVVMCGAVGGAMGKLTVNLTGVAWLCAVCVALLAAVVASVMFQRGIREIGESNAALFSLLEPITSVVFSVWLLHDMLTPRKIVASVFILSGLLIISLQDRKVSS